jgi:Family of unknown function (DUF5681)
MTQSNGDGADMPEGEVKDLPAVGYKRPPVHTRFKAGQSGNPSGRPKGSQNLQTLFQKILNERIPLREGARVRKVSKAEAVMRGLVIGAMKGEPRSVMTLFRLAEQTGQLGGRPPSEIIVSWKTRASEQEGSGP